MEDKAERKKDPTPAFLSFQGPGLALIWEPQGRLHSITQPLVSRQESAVKAFLPVRHCSQSESLPPTLLSLVTRAACTLMLLTALVSKPSLPDFDKLRIVINAQTVMDIR